MVGILSQPLCQRLPAPLGRDQIWEMPKDTPSQGVWILPQLIPISLQELEKERKTERKKERDQEKTQGMISGRLPESYELFEAVGQKGSFSTQDYELAEAKLWPSQREIVATGIINLPQASC